MRPVKSIILLIFVQLLLVVVAVAQVPNLFNYQAVIRKPDGSLVFEGDTISLKISIVNSSVDGDVEYAETHSITINNNQGMVNLTIGGGKVEEGRFDQIDWSEGEKYIMTEADLSGGSNFSKLSTVRLLSVPYAIQAKKAQLSWNVDGNEDTEKTYFLGTTNESPLSFKVHNRPFGYMGATSNIALGDSALYYNKNKTGHNLAIGSKALITNSTGYHNIALGSYALADNQTGYQNISIGTNSLISNSTGYYNVAIGQNAIFNNTTGVANTAVGFYASNKNTTGIQNVAIGRDALFNNSTGNYNVAAGRGALYRTLNGGNVAVGDIAMEHNTNGYKNTAIGYRSGTTLSTGYNNTVIGAEAQVPDGSDNNQVRIGNADVESAGIQVAWEIASDYRWKKNVVKLKHGLDLINSLKPVEYVRKNNNSNTKEIGFIAQDIEQTLLELRLKNYGIIHRDNSGYLSLRYNDFIPILTKAIQEQQLIIEKLKQQIADQADQNNKMMDQINDIYRLLQARSLSER